MTHWCHDIPRDQAVRAAEDGRSGPLPTLEEAIAAITQRGNDMATKAEIQAADYRAEATSERTEGVTERRPPDPRGRGNVTGHADTGANTGDRGWHRKQWDDAVGIICDGGSWGRGNSFDVAKIGALMIWADKEMRQTVGLRSMLDAAIRERDALKDIIVASESAPSASGAAVLAEIAAAFGCDPDDDADLVESARLLVKERDDAVAKAASGAAGTEVVLPECPFTPESTHTMGWWEAIGKVKKALAAAGVTVKEVGR